KGTSSLDNTLERFSGMVLALSDIRIVWDDQAVKKKFGFVMSDLNLYVGKDALALEAEIIPPQSLGEHVEIKLVAEGPLRSPRQWNSHYFVHGDEINLAGVPYLRSAVLSQTDAGTLDLELWGSSYRDSGFGVQGSVALHDVRVNAPSTVDAPSPARFSFIDELAADVQISGDFQNWQVDMNNLSVITPQKHWPKSGFSIGYDHSADAYQGVIDYLDVESVRTIATLMPGLTEQHLSLLARLQPVGELRDIDFTLPRDLKTLDTMSLKASFEDIGWGEYDKLPGVQSLSGQVLATPKRGVARLEGHQVEVDYPRLFPEILEAKTLHSDITWERNGDLWDFSLENISIANGDFSATGGAHLVLGKGEQYPDLTMELIAPSVPLNRISHYIPYRIVPPKSGKWLRQAFSEGVAENIRVSYSGPARKKAFKNGDARLLAEFDIKKASLNYHEKWPGLSSLEGSGRFENSHFTAAVKQGQVLGARIRQAKVEIKDLFLARLKVTGKASGKLPQALKFVEQSPLNRNLDDFLQKVTSSGDLGLNLNLELTLSKKLKKFHRARGVIDLQHCEAAIPENDVQIEDLQGKLNFDNTFFSADSLTGVFRGSPVEATVNTNQNETIEVHMTGDWAPADLLPSQQTVISPVTSGRASWQGVLSLPHHQPGETKRSPWLQVTSNLVGVDIDLPFPLTKTPAEPRKLFVEYQFSKKLPHLKIDYSDLLSFSGEMQIHPEFTVRRGELALQQQIVALPDRGISVMGQWPQIDVASWAEIISRYAGKNNAKKENILDRVNYLDVDVKETIVSTQHFYDAHLRADKYDGEWVAQVEAPAVAGKVFIPIPLGRQPVRARLGRLFLQRGGNSKGSEDFKPQSLPPLLVQSERFRWGKLAFQNLLLSTKPLAEGMEITALEIKTDYLHAESRGRWLKSNQGESSDFSFAVKGKDVGKILQALGHGGSLGSGSGNLKGHLGWVGSPASFNIATLAGSLNIDLKDGWLQKVEPGLGRLLGLLSLDYLPRRLALNFKDMEERGFYYDKLKGKAKVKQGLLETPGLTIDGPVATFFFTGSTDLIDGQYNLTLLVVPKLASTAPWAAGLIAGPQAGVAVFFLDKLAESLGIDINRSIALDYVVTGSWEKPDITALNLPPPDDEDDLTDFLAN
ncbi:MAG TPA: TIGR02099 family protein, partial [Gammaproteobacteria bacterium]|nr:TIGR02099 family protein [Gammaproteobacteria bacterium]